MSHIPADDRDLWIKMGMAVKSELPDDEGFDLWDAWSHNADSYKEQDAKSVWRGIKPSGGVGIGTLFHEAKGNGWPDNGAVRMLSAAKIKERDAERAAKDAADAAKKAADQQAVAQRASVIWDAAAAANADHPYLAHKGVQAHGLKVYSGGLQIDGMSCDGALVVPLRVSGIIQTLQFIGADGVKRFLPGGAKKGAYYAIGKPQGTLCIVEGFATGASIHEATGHAVAVAVDAGNLQLVAQALRAKKPELSIILCADNDRFTATGNTGIRSATEAAQAVSGLLAVPQFQSDVGTPTDFNDLHKIEGMAAVKASIDSADRVQSDGTQSGMQQSGWADPEPLTRSSVAVPYPVDALPDVVRMAVEEVQGFTKAPAAMVACSALANLSLAAQAHHDVQRAEKLSGAIGLYFLVIAESGERKSTCDGIFSKVIRDYEAQQQEDAKPDMKRYNADMAAWDAIRSGILDAIKQAAKSAKDTGQGENDLRRHEEIKPEPPRVPRLIYSDFTPEALTYSLAKSWPSGGVISSEAGAVFGSHGMGKDSQLRTLANLNQLWDAAKLTFDRRGESYVVDGARLTMSLQVQESALLEFFSRTGTLARGTGFLARFLMADPESTQGTRLFTEPPENMPALACYHSEINRILQAPAPINDRGGLEPSMLALTPEAKGAWIRFHDEIETGLGKGGELQEVRDVASKIADNAVRLAALFHIIGGGIGAISLDNFVSASVIAAWHLNEALRFFGELALPEAEADAAALDEWLIDYCNVNRVDVVPTRTISQYGPYKVRGKERLQAAVDELIERGRVVIAQSGRKREIQINPQLLAG
ncbi:MAG: DUF3987 domain-containing protein [Herminiimonas sp.]|nr:DUF3987 domain-containing protein [Herminiimonas sp.]